MRQTRCIDCNRLGRKTDRAAYNTGPRCSEHWREELQKRRKAAHGKRIQKVYQIGEVIYDLLYRSQGGRCFICRKATGKRKRLAVDHDHQCDQGHDPKTGCTKCIRCLACGPCNKDVLGRLDEAALRRAIIVLTDPPARPIITAYLKENGPL